MKKVKLFNKFHNKDTKDDNLLMEFFLIFIFKFKVKIDKIK